MSVLLTDGPGTNIDRISTLWHSMRRTRRYTIAPNGWFQTAISEGTGLWGTQFLTVGCPDDFYAVRLGFANIAPTAYAIPRIVVCPSTTWNDYSNPTGDHKPTTLTTVFGGADDSRLVTAPDAPYRLRVGPNLTDPSSGETTVPAWSWTDWCPVTNASPDPQTGMRVLMIRHTLDRNDGGLVTFANGTLRGWTGDPSVHGGYDYFCGGVKNGTDRTGFEHANPAVLPANMIVNGSFVAAVQFLTPIAGIVGVTTGDSHHQGTSTSGSFNSYLAQATYRYEAPKMGAFPSAGQTARWGALHPNSSLHI